MATLLGVWVSKLLIHWRYGAIQLLPDASFSASPASLRFPVHKAPMIRCLALAALVATFSGCTMAGGPDELLNVQTLGAPVPPITSLAASLAMADTAPPADPNPAASQTTDTALADTNPAAPGPQPAAAPTWLAASPEPSAASFEPVAPASVSTAPAAPIVYDERTDPVLIQQIAELTRGTGFDDVRHTADGRAILPQPMSIPIISLDATRAAMAVAASDFQ